VPLAHGLDPRFAATTTRGEQSAFRTRARRLLGDARGWADLGKRFGESLTEAEVRYLAKEECAETAEDVVWRRSLRVKK
jgi:glycerol-3-phosphate dehydrogenase